MTHIWTLSPEGCKRESGSLRDTLSIFSGGAHPRTGRAQDSGDPHTHQSTKQSLWELFFTRRAAGREKTRDTRALVSLVVVCVRGQRDRVTLRDRV